MDTMQRAYMKCFNSITNTIELLTKLLEDLKSIQIETEELYVQEEDQTAL